MTPPTERTSEAETLCAACNGMGSDVTERISCAVCSGAGVVRAAPTARTETTPETAAYLRGVFDGTVVVTAAQMAALKAAAKRAHEEVPGADVMRAFCVCGYNSMGSDRPLCALIRSLHESAEVVS